VALLDLKRKSPLQKLPESVAILVWPAEAAIGTGAKEAVEQSILLAPAPPLTAPIRVRRSLTNHLTEEHACTAMLRDGRYRTVERRPLRYVSQLLWVRLLTVICHSSAGHAIVITAPS